MNAITPSALFTLTSMSLILLGACATPEEQLQNACRRADRITVRTAGIDGHEMTSVPPCEIRGAGQVASFLDALDFEPGPRPACKCLGNVWIDVFDESQLLATLSVHHGERVSWRNGSWSGHLVLTRTSLAAVDDWLADNGCPTIASVETGSRQSANPQTPSDDRAATPSNSPPVFHLRKLPGHHAIEDPAGLLAAAWPDGRIVRAPSVEKAGQEYVEGRLDPAQLDAVLDHARQLGLGSGNCNQLVTVDAGSLALTIRLSGEWHRCAESIPLAPDSPLAAFAERVLATPLDDSHVFSADDARTLDFELLQDLNCGSR